jgi:hypothetical protein
MSGLPLMSGGVINNAYARYATNTQTQPNANECEIGTNCAINSPQTQGDGMLVHRLTYRFQSLMRSRMNNHLTILGWILRSLLCSY